ncbi:MAG TPA: hypothetical protein VIT44_18240 [Cyclobacteriaceae bacterium]
MKIDNAIDILIFKTNIETEHDLNKVASLLNTENRIRKWSVDRQDIDHVLRIESEGADQTQIKEKIAYAGFLCEDLID